MSYYEYKERRAYVYVLTDMDKNVFYVGCTTQTLTNRLLGHLNAAKKNYPYTNIAKNEKIRSLDFNVLIKEVDCVTVKAISSKKAILLAEKLEHQWIVKIYTSGIMLFNSQREIFRALNSVSRERKIITVIQ